MRLKTMQITWLPPLAASLSLLAAVVTAACGTPSSPSDDTPWVAHLDRMNEALAHGDVSGAVRAHHATYLAALASGRWEGMAAVGDASMQLAKLAGSRRAMEAEARRAYLAALFRARRQRSVDGMLHVAESFAALGDRDAARQALVMAAAMATATQRPDLTERIRALREHLESRAPAALHEGLRAGRGPSASGADAA